MDLEANCGSGVKCSIPPQLQTCHHLHVCHALYNYSHSIGNRDPRLYSTPFVRVILVLDILERSSYNH